MSRHHGIPFDISFPVGVFEKASAPEGQQRRIGGIASVETKDRQDETLLARGLDFSDFLDNGWFNDNHSKKTTDIVGFPNEHHMFKKGAELPNGETAEAPGHWVEGYLLEGHPPADEIWNLSRSLAKTHRRLGFSVEGKVIQRLNKSNGKVVAKAKVRNVAITNCPVNTGARMEVLVKSLQAVEAGNDEDLLQTISERLGNLEKALTMGTATGINPPPGPQTGEDAGQVISGQSLEGKNTSPRNLEEDENEKTKRKSKKDKLSKGQVVAWVRKQIPHASAAQVRQFIELTRKLKSQSRL